MIAYKVYRFLSKNVKCISHLSRFVFKVSPVLMELYYRIMPVRKKIFNTDAKRDKKIIISLTTIPSRIDSLWITLSTISRQSVKPDKIIVWLDEDNFKNFTPSGRLKIMVKYGVEIVTDIPNLKSHKKYFYTFQRYPDDLVITIDDDVLYPYDTIEHLFELYQKYPDCVCCKRGNFINDLQSLINENDKISNLTPSFSYMATGVGGVLYPPKLFDKELYNVDSIIACKALCTDDLWLKIIGVLSLIKTVRHPIQDNLMEIPGSQRIALFKVNTGNSPVSNGNEVAIRLLMQRYRKSILERMGI